MISRSGLATCLAWVAAAVLVAAPVSAQDFRGGVRGTVADSTGGVLPGVTVTIANADTGVAQTVVTDDKGRFEVLYLNAGAYTVTAELSGFKTVVRKDNQVRVGDVLQLDVQLSAGGVSETVQVTADTPAL